MPDDFLELGDGEKKDELILGKFKTPEDLAKAYSELEGKFTQTSQESAATKKTVEELQAKIQTISTQAPIKPEENDDDYQQIFVDPKGAIEKIIEKSNAPFKDALFEMGKQAFKAATPDFEKYEARINEIVATMPNLKTQPGIVGQLYKMVRGLDFDPAAYEKEVREKLKKETQDKVDGALEEGGASELPGGGSKKATLSEEEKRTARKFNPNMAPEEAYKRYVTLRDKPLSSGVKRAKGESK